MRPVRRPCFAAAFASMLVACGDQPKETSVESPGSRVTPLQPAPAAGEVPSWAKVAPEQIEAAKKAGVPVAFENSIGMRFVLVPAGTFTRGSPETEPDREQDETPHRVTLTKGFYMAVTETTNGQYRRFDGSHKNAKGFDEDDQPVAYVNSDDADRFVAWLSRQDGSRSYALPTEAQWEYACRAGTTTAYSFGADASRSDDYAWTRSNSGGKTHTVGTKAPSGWGLYDMQGNVWEWCQDWYDDYTAGAVQDPSGPLFGSYRVLRGGSWRFVAAFTRSAFRNWTPEFPRDGIIGFRVVASRRL